MEIDPESLRKKMSFWVNKGVLKSISENEWVLLEVAEEVDNINGNINFTAYTYQ